MKKFLLNFLLLIIIGVSTLNAQSFYGQDAKNIIQSADEVHFNEKTNQIDYISFKKDQQILFSQLNLWINKQYNLGDNASLVELNRTTDQLGLTHIRYYRMKWWKKLCWMFFARN